jgi:BatD DUF11 like domain
MAWSQKPAFVAEADVKEAVVGMPFEVTFTLHDGETQRFIPPSFKDFKTSGGASETRGMTIINGRASGRQAWAFTLEPTRAGVFTIGPATVTVGGQLMQTKPLTIKVLPPATASKGGLAIPPGKDDQVFIVGAVNSDKVYLGQQVTWRLTLYTRVAIEGADLIALPDFSGFYSKEKRRFDTRTGYQTIRGKKYAVRVLHEEALFPQSEGDLTIGAAQIRVGLDQPGAQGFFYGPKPVTLTAQPSTIKVLPLPSPAPELFTGGVGQYTWEVTADTTALTTDDALTLTVTLKGNGDARRFAPPKIKVPAAFEIFEPRVIEEEEYESESELVHTKRLEYIILPKAPGTQTLQPEMSFFDPDSNRYVTATATAIPFTVVAGKNYRPPSAIDTVAAPVSTAVQVGFLSKFADFLASPWLWGAAGMVLLGMGGLFLFKNRRRKEPQKPVAVAHKDLAAAAQQRFTQVASLRFSSPPQTFYNELLKSLQSYMAARLDLQPAQLNHAMLRARLAERGVTPIRVQAFLSILQTCEQAVFSGHSDASKMESDWQAAETVVQALDKEMRQ